MAGVVLFTLYLYTLVQYALAAETNCSRIFHSAVVSNGKLYIDGGEMHTRWPNDTISTKPIDDLETIDLTKSWVNSDTDLYTYIPKPLANNTAIYLDEGAAWSDGDNLFFYGGYVSGVNGPSVPPLGTWKYNIASNEWDHSGFSGAALVRLCQGGAVQSSSKAYYLGGSLNPGGNPSFAGTAGADVYMDPGLITLDMDKQEWTNASTADMNEWGTIGDGYTSLLESAGDEGVIVAFGGYKYPVGQTLSYLAYRQNETIHRNSMEMVRVYDIAEQKWYTQQTSGDVPGWRMSGCTVVAPAQDLSSYSIYVFGGMANTTALSDGNVYVLSVPSFRWIRVTDDNSIRIKHKCVRPQNNTMIVVGGNIPVTNGEYDPLPQNCDSATFANGIGIFDLHSLSWMSNYNASYNDAYRIPSKVSDVIGGSETGGATVVSPKDGFNSTSMESLFKNRNNATDSGTSSTSTSSTTGQSSSGSKESLSGGGIAGVTVGCVAGVGLIAGLAWFLTRRHRKAKAASSTRLAWQNDASAIPPLESPQKELYGSGPEVHEMGVRDQPRFEMPAENMAVEMPAEVIKR
ncbi:Kelch motif [Aspergillus parasiticus SU-1]|uniref:Kelch motif n=1 Tax=Aspergillus parasiticus (strain ATCC 56775 / NRRL 5862 / SRRC 143 / SU-1) TaxID=1403190 RepID=A0A0F0I592_ASPPU|nr:Kelch motif [Aspergillus parasiticus SU-1]